MFYTLHGNIFNTLLIQEYAVVPSKHLIYSFSMVAIMDVNLDSSAYHFVAVDSSSKNSENVAGSNIEPVVIRTVAMSANIASTVKDEVKHLIRINTFSTDSVFEEDGSEEKVLHTVATREYHQSNNQRIQSSCSHILPTAEENIISAIVLSKWDDIMGPQTVYLWLPEFSSTKVGIESGVCASNSSPVLERTTTKSTGQSTCCHASPEQNALLTRAIKYVTCHTVNYVGVCPSPSKYTYEQRSSNFFVVPDLELVTQSLVFYVHCAELSAPFSLAVLVDYTHYTYFLHLRQLCQQWLHRMTTHLHGLLLKFILSNSVFESSIFAKLNYWVLELCNTASLLGVSGLRASPMTCNEDILNHPLLERALSSHLQTYGCTVVMGTCSTDINLIISLLSLFLDCGERFCSCLVLPTVRYSFHMGLFLQGLLLDEFGCRELSSVELAASPYLVTAVDLTQGIHPSAVKQTPSRHLRQGEWEDAEQGTSHRSILRPVKESASLVRTLLNDMRCLPKSQWQSFIDLFLQKVNSLAHTLLSLTHYFCEDGLRRNSVGGTSLVKHLMWTMNLHEGDFFIVLAAADKLKPGVYSYTMELDTSMR